MEVHNYVQGTPEWHALRASVDGTASEASAMMGASKHTTRNELLKQKATGVVPEVDSNTQSRFDRGHKVEAAARPIVEERLGEDLYPITVTANIEGLTLLASLDGAPMDVSVVWENKLSNAELLTDIQHGELDPHYYWQLEQQLLITGARRAYFTITDGTELGTIGVWYQPVPGRREQLIAGWKQFKQDIANYQHVEVIPAAKADPIEGFPVAVITVSGRLASSNLPAITPRFDSFLASVNKTLNTDSDFANGESTAKFGRATAKALKVKAQEVIEQISDISEATRVLNHYAEKFDAMALELEKLVKSRKEAIRTEIIGEAEDELATHIKLINAKLPAPVRLPKIATDFHGVIKSKRTVESVRNAVSSELARAKVDANMTADLIKVNLETKGLHGYKFLFNDLSAIVTKPNEDFINTVTARIAAYEAEEERKAKAAAAEKALQDNAAFASAQKTLTEATTVAFKETVVSGTGVVVTDGETAATVSGMSILMDAQVKRLRPTDEEIIAVLVNTYQATEIDVIRWLRDLDIEEAFERLTEEFA